jgi:Fe-S-cluster-containing dehydrogenase component
MAKYGMVVDIARCNGCYNCFLACRDEHCGNDFPPYSASQPHTGHYWMRLVEKERGQYPKVKVAYTAVPCLQCDKPACVDGAQAVTGGDGSPSGGGSPSEASRPGGSAPNGAVYQRADGIVLIDPRKAVGRKEILSRCPYRVIFWNEEKRLPQKCTFCAHLLDKGWREPRCVEACPTRALVFGDLHDPDSEVAKLVASGRTEALHPGYDLGDKVRYIGLPKRFIAGAVVYGDTDRCGEGAEVTLREEDPRVTGAQDGGVKRAVRADNYGDFDFEGLQEGADYRVIVSAPGYESRELVARTNQDVYLGEIVLVRSGGGR